MTALVLGTAQFGNAYGITNAVGRLDDEAVSGIVARAREAGIDTFDTASDYGDSQTRLGALSPEGNRYITKFSLPVDGSIGVAALYASSAEALGVPTLAGVMFHKIADLNDPRADHAVALLREARAEGTIERAGVSIYDSDDLDLALAVFPDLDLVQLPGNVVDRRMLDHPRIESLREAGAEIYVRSAFLQGILLADASTLPLAFAGFGPVLRELDRAAADRNTSRVALALAFLRDEPGVDGVVVGATTTTELEGIIEAWSSEPAPGGIDLPGIADDLLDPRRWRR